MQNVVLRATWYEGTAQLLSLTEFKSHLFQIFILLAESLTDEGGEETGVHGENPWRRALEADALTTRPTKLLTTV